jgi:hypothetical protein
MTILKTPENFHEASQSQVKNWVLEKIKQSDVVFYDKMRIKTEEDGRVNISIDYADEYERIGSLKHNQDAKNNSKTIHKILGDIQDTLRQDGHICTQARGDLSVKCFGTNVVQQIQSNDYGKELDEPHVRYGAIEFSFASKNTIMNNMVQKLRTESQEAPKINRNTY